MDKNTWDWDAITAISTAAAAVFTAVMAWFTRKAIREGQGQRQEANDHFAKTREQDKHHHENGFRPLLVLTPSRPGDAVDRKEILSVYRYPTLDVVCIKCAVCNIGPGPALNVHIHVRGDRRTGFGPSRELVPIAPDSSFPSDGAQIEMAVAYTPAYNNADLNNLPNGLWLLVLEYEDVFGNTFHTIHSRDLQEPWTRVGRGPAPDTTPPPPDDEHALLPAIHEASYVM
jgi:hypothetical protein